MAKKLPKWLVKQIEQRARAERRAGAEIEINEYLPSITILFPSGDEYFLQEWEAEDLLNEVPDNVYAEDYILAMAQNW